MILLETWHRTGSPGTPRHRRRAGLATALALAASAAACTADDPDDGAAEAFTADPDCFGIEVAGLSEDEVQCGTVTVPLDHDEPDGEQIELAVAVLAGEDGAPEDPVLLLGGGPGQVMVRTVLGEPLQQRVFDTDRETILVDQRGVGASEPALSCPEAFGEDMRDTVAEDTDALLDAYSECRDALADQGVDLTEFNYRNNALDVDAVRAALGHDELNIRGGSYGSHLALHAAALNPDGVRSLVLSSPIDPSTNFLTEAAGGFDTALQRVVEACAATVACATQVGDVEGSIGEVVDRLAEEPESVTVQPPEGDETTVTYTPAAFLNGLYTLFYLADGAFALPALVDDAREGDLGPLARILATVDEQLQEAGTAGMQMSMVCSGDGGTFDADAAAASISSDLLAEYWFPHSVLGGAPTTALCDVWDVDQVFDPAEFAYAEAVPALVFTGELDHVTPPQHGERVADALETAHLVEVPSVGHSPLAALDLFVDGCGRGLVDEFLTDPQSRPDTACVGRMPPLEPPGELPETP